MRTNLLLARDGYKNTHHLQMKEGLNKLISYGSPRKGGLTPEVVHFGMQYFIQEHLMNVPTLEDIEEAEAMQPGLFGTTAYSDRKVWEKVAELGYFPIRIKSLPEGTVIEEGNATFTIESTEDWFAATLNSIETELMHIWYPTTIATNSMMIKRDLLPLYKQTSTAEDLEFALSLAVNDFGLRGASSLESGSIGGAAHGLFFRGSDNMHAQKLLKDYYQCDQRLMSVWATEHSVATSYGPGQGEFDYANAQLDRVPDNMLFSIVADSFDTMNFVSNVIGSDEIKAKIIAREGRTVIRPDSGDPKEQVIGILNRLEKIFGVTVNSKGYKVINHNVGVIQGDGMHRESIKDLYEYIISEGYSVDNLAVGSGGGLLQEGFTRDTHRYAIKAIYGEQNGVPFDIQKKPKTDMSKASFAGKLKVVEQDGRLVTVKESEEGLDVMITMYDNGKTNFEDFNTIEERVNKQFK